MLEIEKLQKRFPGISANDILRQYERDVANAKTEEVSQVPPLVPQPNDDLFHQGEREDPKKEKRK